MSRVQGGFNSGGRGRGRGTKVRPGKEKVKKSSEIIVIQPGLVWLKNIISIEDQQRLIDLSIEYGEGIDPEVGSFYEGKIIRTSEGFIDTDRSARVYSVDEVQIQEDVRSRELNLVTKARLSIPLETCPALFLEKMEEYLNLAREADDSMPESEAKVCRINYYTKRGRIGWHRDRDGLTEEQQKTVTSPIISLSLGSTGLFSFKNNPDDEDQQIQLASGDVLIFGGPSRMLLHAVPQILSPKTIPQSLTMNNYDGRFNIGFY